MGCGGTMSNVWFTSDLHLGHRNIHKYRTQFESEEHHREVIKENYHKVVTKRDKVFFLGDVAFTQECLADVGTWVGERKVLIVGNHCVDNIPMSEIVKHFDEVYSLLKYKEYWLSHAPIHPNELRGKYNLHGHVHYASLDDPRYLNCCLENTDYAPIDLNEVRRRLGVQK
jgi:calcineurin-like phosphoesterase family protein